MVKYFKVTIKFNIVCTRVVNRSYEHVQNKYVIEPYENLLNYYVDNLENPKKFYFHVVDTRRVGLPKFKKLVNTNLIEQVIPSSVKKVHTTNLVRKINKRVRISSKEFKKLEIEADE
jgi:hypothetical protein